MLVAVSISATIRFAAKNIGSVRACVYSAILTSLVYHFIAIYIFKEFTVWYLITIVTAFIASLPIVIFTRVAIKVFNWWTNGRGKAAAGKGTSIRL